MTPEQSQIFQPFEQVGTALSHSEGSGLGLAISQQILSVMGSQIEVDSALGEGSRFWFDLNLPRSTQFAQSMILYDINSNQIVGYKGRRLKILVVDDEASNRTILVELLQPLGFICAEADNGAKALENVPIFEPDVILIDLIMPVLDGFEFIHQLNQKLISRKLIVLATSADAMIGTRNKCLEAGFKDFLLKPINLETLLHCLETQLKLEWIYETISQANQCFISQRNDAAAWVIPPKEYLE